MSKECPRCKKTYMFEEKHFYKDKTRKDGLLPICKNCKNGDSLYYRSKKNINKTSFTLKCENEKCDVVFTTFRTDKKFCCKKCRDNQFYLDRFRKGYGDKRAFNGRFKRAKEKAKNSRIKWNKKDEAKLIEMRYENKIFKEIAKELKRGVEACIIKHGLLKKDMINRKILVNVDIKDKNAN